MTQQDIEAFAAQCTLKIAAYYAENRYDQAPIVICERGPKYTRLVRSSVLADGTICERSAYGFVDNATGDLLKADGWKRPAKGIRSNIAKHDAIKRCSPYSVS